LRVCANPYVADAFHQIASILLHIACMSECTFELAIKPKNCYFRTYELHDGFLAFAIKWETFEFLKNQYSLNYFRLVLRKVYKLKGTQFQENIG
jgi:hypothetical protein